MTLLTVAQDVCDVIGSTRPAAVVASADPLARQILALAKETLEELGLMNWPVLEIPYTFNTVVGQAQYALPADFGREVGDTVYVANQYSSLRGSLTPSDWQRQRNAMQANLGRYRFRVFGMPLMLNLAPTPGVVDTLVLEYQSAYRVKRANGAYETTFFADDDTALVPSTLMYKGLKWRLRRAKGLDYSEEFNDYEMDRAQRLAQSLGMGSMPVAYRAVSDDEMPPGPYIPESGFG